MIPQAWGGVEVDQRGLWVRGQLVVPAHQIATVELIPGPVAALVTWFPPGGRAISSKHNLYGGGFGWGKGVLVERATSGPEPPRWLLPGPRPQRLADALTKVRDDAIRRHHGAGRT